MKSDTFKIAHKLVTGPASLERLNEEVERLGLRRPLIVTDTVLRSAGTVGLVERQLGGVAFDVFEGVQPEPEIQVVDASKSMFAESNCDSLIAVGGGSAIDIAKAGLFAQE